MDLPLDLIPLLAAFDAGGVRFLVVGGHAVSIHSRPRYTKDLDLWLAPAPDNVARAVASLEAFGAPRAICDALARARLDEVVWIGRVPARVDFLLQIPGVDPFDDCWLRRQMVDANGVPVPVIGRDDLIRNKEAVGRPQDRRDVRELRGRPESKTPRRRR